MSIINGVIKTLSSKFGITLPITVTSAVKDATTGESLDVTLNNINNKTDKIGNLSELPTTEKGSLVGAVTELNSQLAKFLFAKNSIIDCNEQGDNFIASFSNFDGTGHAPEGEVRGILMTMVDSKYPNEGAQTTQIFFSFYNHIYIRTIWSSQSWGTWTIVV